MARWGLNLSEVEQLGDSLATFWGYYGQWTCTKTRDTSHDGLCYLSGLPHMDSQRTYANIGRQSEVRVQNMHHFMSNSPWSGPLLISKVQAEVGQQDEFQSGSMLLLDESADDKSGAQYGQRHTYTFSNDPVDAPLLTMANENRSNTSSNAAIRMLKPGSVGRNSRPPCCRRPCPYRSYLLKRLPI